MHTDIFEKCSYFFKTPPMNRLDFQLVNTGRELAYYNVYLSDTYLVEFLWKYYISHVANQPKYGNINTTDEDYICRVFEYTVTSFGNTLDYDLFCSTDFSLNPVEHRLATILVYYIQNPITSLKSTVLLQSFEYFRSLILIKMGFISQLLLTCCLHL